MLPVNDSVQTSLSSLSPLQVRGALHTAEQHLPPMPALLVSVHCERFHLSLLYVSRSLLQSNRHLTVEQGLASNERHRDGVSDAVRPRGFYLHFYYLVLVLKCGKLNAI